MGIQINGEEFNQSRFADGVVLIDSRVLEEIQIMLTELNA